MHLRLSCPGIFLEWSKRLRRREIAAQMSDHRLIFTLFIMIFLTRTNGTASTTIIFSVELIGPENVEWWSMQWKTADRGSRLIIKISHAGVKIVPIIRYYDCTTLPFHQNFNSAFTQQCHGKIPETRDRYEKSWQGNPPPPIIIIYIIR